MAQDERLTFDIFARLREDGFSRAGKAASAASDDVLGLARRLDELSRKSATARVSLAGDKEALAQLDKLDLKLLTTGRKVVDPKISLDGAAKAQAEIAALEVSLDKLGSKSADVTESVGSGGLAGPAGMGALIGAGVALSPIVATVTTGVAGFGLAAAGAVAPVMKAAQATGGLRANMAKLDPEQQRLAKSVLGLGQEYHAFEKSLQPEVLAVFGKGIQTAGHLLHDVQPIAAATGKALGVMLGEIDREFQSGTWQNFFGFMERTAGPDIKLVTSNLTDFMNLLPPLLMDLQPLGEAILRTSDDLLKLAAAASKGFGSLTSVNNAASDTPKHAGLASQAWHLWEKAVRGAEDATSHLFTWIPGLNTETSKTAKSIGSVATEATQSVTPVFNLTTAVKGLTDAMAKNVGEVLTLQGDELQWRQSLQAATKQLDSNSAGLRGNSKDALANKAAVLQATQNVMTFADDQLTLGGNLNAASKRIQDQIAWLQRHGDKSKFARDEIRALRLEEDKLRATIKQRLEVSASGTWHVIGGGQTVGPSPGGNRLRTAQGAFVTGGIPGQDSVPIMAMPGELVVPTRLVSAGLVDHLRGMIPGFADGGVVSSYSGGVGGMAKWLAVQDSATLRALESATARATAAGIKSAQAASAGAGVAGPGGGAPAANAALARRMYPPWGHGAEWSSWNAIAMAESGWNQFARNPSSGAYGIPQALPPSKMGAAANPPQSNPHAQISWMIGYLKSRYGDPINAWNFHKIHGWYAKGGPVGGKAAPPDPQRKKWLAQLERDVKVLHEDQKHARQRRKILRHSVEIDELWFLTHPNVRKHGIGWDEHERALRNDQRRLSHFNKRESDKEKALAAKIAILRDLTGFPKARKYGGPGTPGPDPGAGDGGAGGGDTGGGTTSAPSGPPPVPPPPMPEWMVQAGLGGAPSPVAFPAQGMASGGMSFPEPVTYPGAGMGGWHGFGSRGGGGLADLISAIRAMHADVVGAVGQVAPRTARGFDMSQNSMAARVAGRFS